MPTPFGAETTTDDVLQGVDLSGKRILVTGVSAGLGVETARALTAHGAEVVGAARDLDKARTATAGIPRGLTLTQLDLASLASVRACADRLNAEGRPIDGVIANAGVMATPKGVTADGAPAFSWKTIPQGAATSVWAAVVAPADEIGGRYCEDCHVARLEPDPAVRAGVKPYALDPERAKALWALSERLVGERF
jgi:NAD(P)-dependent dehydrogenase (short-subunit alcohol dehydrogenase family)